MQFKENEPVNTIKPYSISLEEFEVPPKELQPYKPLDKITRDNFTNFLIESFRVSMGRPEVQFYFFKWLKLKTGFDYSIMLSNLTMAGGWNALSEIEKEEFKRRFREIKKHLENFPELKKGFDTDDEMINDEMEANIDYLYNKEILDNVQLSVGIGDGDILKQIEKIDTFQDFHKFAVDKVMYIRKENP